MSIRLDTFICYPVLCYIGSFVEAPCLFGTMFMFGKWYEAVVPGGHLEDKPNIMFNSFMRRIILGPN